MAVFFYIILVLFSDIVSWNWWWFAISLLFSIFEGRKIVYKYRYTTDTEREDEEVEE